MKINSRSEIIEHAHDSEEAVTDVGTMTTTHEGFFVAIQGQSGLIKRCSASDCTRVVTGGECSEHGAVDGEFDLRIKAVIDDGHTSQECLFTRGVTEEVTGIDLEEAKELAADALDFTVVSDRFTDLLIGRRFTVEGPLLGRYLLVGKSKRHRRERSRMATRKQSWNCSQNTTTMGRGSRLRPSRISRARMMHTRAALEATETMATSNSQSQQGATVPDREVAKLVFAAELNEATYTFKTAQNERAPVYVALPTGERANRVCVMGTVTDVEDVGTDDQEYFRVRIVDPTGTFWVYAGQYQHEALKKLKKIQPPEFLTVIGKPRTYKTDDGTINVSLVPEDVGIVDVRTRDIWVFEAARRTLERVESARETSPKVAALARETAIMGRTSRTSRRLRSRTFLTVTNRRVPTARRRSRIVSRKPKPRMTMSTARSRNRKH